MLFRDHEVRAPPYPAARECSVGANKPRTGIKARSTANQDYPDSYTHHAATTSQSPAHHDCVAFVSYCHNSTPPWTPERGASARTGGQANPTDARNTSHIYFGRRCEYCVLDLRQATLTQRNVSLLSRPSCLQTACLPLYYASPSHPGVVPSLPCLLGIN